MAVKKQPPGKVISLSTPFDLPITQEQWDDGVRNQKMAGRDMWGLLREFVDPSLPEFPPDWTDEDEKEFQEYMKEGQGGK